MEMSWKIVKYKQKAGNAIEILKKEVVRAK